DRELDVRQPRQDAAERSKVDEHQQQVDGGPQGMVLVPDRPVREQQQRERQDDQIVGKEVGRGEHGQEHQLAPPQSNRRTAVPAAQGDHQNADESQREADAYRGRRRNQQLKESAQRMQLSRKDLDK